MAAGFEDPAASYDIFSFEISQPADSSNSLNNRHALGIDALSPHTDDVIFPMRNAEGRGSFSSSSIIGGAKGNVLGGERERPIMQEQLMARSSSWGEHHQQSPPPPHIVGLFSPSDHSNSFMRSLSLSPRITPASSYSSYDNAQTPRGDEDSVQYLLSPRDQFSSSKSPQKSPRVYQSEHEEFLSGMGGMDDLDIDLDDEEEDEDQRGSIMSPRGQHSLLGFAPTLRQRGQPFIPQPADELYEVNRALIHSHSYTAGTYEQVSRDVPVRANTSPALSGATAALGDLEGVPCTATFGEHPYGEHPSRTLFVRNINSNVEDDELAALFEAHGPIRSMYTQCKHRGFVMISYYDIRHAKNAMRHLQGKIIRRRKLDIHYSIPKDNPSEKDQNQGTLVIFNLDPSTTNEELKSIFGQYGEIKEIRETPNKKHHKFIEFYDVRDSEKAMKHLNKTEIKGKKIKIEPSRPGGARKNQMNQLALELSGEDDPTTTQASHNGSLSPMPSGFLTPNTAAHPPAASATPASMYYQQAFSPTTSSGQLSPSFDRRNAQSPRLSQPYAHIHQLIPQPRSGSSSPSSMLSPRSQSTSPSPSPVVPGSPTHTPIPIPSSAATTPRGGSAVPFLPIAANGQAKDKQYDPTRLTVDRLPHGFGETFTVLPIQGLQSQLPNFQPRQGGSFVRPPSASTASQSVALSSPRNAPSPSPGAAVTHAPLPIPTSAAGVGYTTTQAAFLSTSAPGFPNNGNNTTGSTSNSNSNNVAPARWNPLPSEGMSLVGQLRFPLNNGEVYSPPSSNPTTPTQSPRINNAKNNGPMKSPRGMVGAIGMVSSSMSSTTTSASASNGGKKSMTHNEDKAQYTLHIDRVKEAVDTRTTLMIKNIPNKYSQKMLLAAVDEHHHGYYDFFYLPIDFKNKCNVGYAFINFINFRSIVPFYEEFNNKKWEKFNSEKVCEITYARIQGKSALIGHFQNSSLMSYEDKKCRPIIIFHRDGSNIGEQKLFPSAIARNKTKGKDDRAENEYAPASLP